MRPSPLLALAFAAGCATTQPAVPPPTPAAPPATPAESERAAEVHAALDAARADLAQDKIEEALTAAKHAEDLLADAEGAQPAELAKDEQVLDGELRPALRQKVVDRYGERYGIKSPQQIDMIWDRGLPAAQLWLGADRRCWRFDHYQADGQRGPGCTLSCWTPEGTLDLELLSTPVVLQSVEKLAQSKDPQARDQVGILLAKGEPVEVASSATRTCWIYEEPHEGEPVRSYELFCWSGAGGKGARLDHYQEVHPQLAFDLHIFDQAEAQYGARTPRQLRTLLSLGRPKQVKTLNGPGGAQRCWLHEAEGQLTAHCWNAAGQLFRYPHVSPAIVPGLDRLGQKYEARSQAQVDLLVEMGPPQSIEKGTQRCWVYPKQRYCFDAGGALVEHTAAP